MRAKSKSKPLGPQGMVMLLALGLGISGMALSAFTAVHQDRVDSRE